MARTGCVTLATFSLAHPSLPSYSPCDVPQAIKFVPRHPKKRLPSLAASRGNGPGPMEEK